MQNPLKFGAATALCATMALTLAPSESLAGVTSVANPSIVGLSSPIDQIHYRRSCHRHVSHYRHYRSVRYYRYGYDPGAALFTAAAAGLLAAGAYGAYNDYPYYGYGGYPYAYGGGPVYWGGGYGYRRAFGGGWGRPAWGGGGFHRAGGHFGGFHGGFHRWR